MRDSEMDIELLVAGLADTPRRIADLAAGRGDVELRSRPSEEAWSAREILAHLRACADVWGKAIDRMLAENGPTIRHLSPRSWIRKTDYLETEFWPALESFAEQRRMLVEALSGLDPLGWSRTATVTSPGNRRSATVLTYAERMRDHELRHLDQLRRTIQE